MACKHNNIDRVNDSLSYCIDCGEEFVHTKADIIKKIAKEKGIKCIDIKIPEVG